jgi:integrase
MAWLVDYFDQNGVRHIKTFEKKKDAEGYRANTLHEVKEGTHTAPSASITVSQAASLWLERAELEGLERSTTKSYVGHLRWHINPLLGAMKLADLTTPRVQAFANDLIGRPYADDPKRKLSRSMARKVLGSLKGIIREAQRKGKISKDPAGPVSIKVPKRGTRKIKPGRDFPSKAEVSAMLGKTAGRQRPLIVTAVFTGMRSSELRGLRWEDCDLDAKLIHVRQRADAWGKMGAPKSEAGERTIPMTPMVVNALKEWKPACPPGALVFANKRAKVADHSDIAKKFYALQVEAGIEPARYGFHTLRHFFASWLIEQAFSPKKVQGILGHASMAMTYDTYGHMFPNHEDDHAKFAAAEAAMAAT